MSGMPACINRLRACGVLCLFALVFATNLAPAATPAAASRNIGIEGHVSVTLGRADLRPRPLDDRTPMVLRIENITPADGGGFVYNFHYMGLEPGDYQLAQYLMLPDGSPAPQLDGRLLHVSSILPANHDGALNPHVPQPFPWFGGYRMMLALLIFLWIGGLAAFIYFGRKKKQVVVEEAIAPPPTFAERIRPFVESAAAGMLSTSGQAELERLLTGFWREKLELPDQRMADALAELKRHDEAGELLRALERWLHRPGGASDKEVKQLLEPYRQVPDAKKTKEVAA